MKYSSLFLCLIVAALVGCEKASEPVNKAERQGASKDQRGVSPPLALWSPEFRDQTLKECTQSATANGDSKGVLKCKCVVDKASTTIPEQRFKAVQTDPEVKDMIRQIGVSC